RHRHRVRVRRQGVRDLPATARPGRVRGHRHRTGHRQEDRRISWRTDLAGPRRRGRHLDQLHRSGAAGGARAGNGFGTAERGHRMTIPTRADGTPIEVLLVEDDPGDVLMTQEAFEEHKVRNRLTVVSDGEEALAYLRREGRHADAPRPDLILRDLNLPRIAGPEALPVFKEDPDPRRIAAV